MALIERTGEWMGRKKNQKKQSDILKHHLPAESLDEYILWMTYVYAGIAKLQLQMNYVANSNSQK